MKNLTDRELVGRPLWLILLLFNMLVCAYSRHIGWMLFWALAFSSCAYEYGYEYGKPNNGDGYVYKFWKLTGNNSVTSRCRRLGSLYCRATRVGP